MNKQRTLRVYNGFGVTPTTSYTAAGLDFYIPDLSDIKQGTEKYERVMNALSKSYGMSVKSLEGLAEKLVARATFTYNVHMGDIQKKVVDSRKTEGYDGNVPTINDGIISAHITDNALNLLLLYCSLDGALMRMSQNMVNTFCEAYLTWAPDTLLPGLKLHCNDHVFINSGIKTKLESGYAGIFFNKSGRGKKGLDVRAQVVDEDYAGYVHLNLAYTKDNVKDGILYSGDKVTQMVVLPVYNVQAVIELDEAEYDEAMKDSLRGDAGFGSTDNVKKTV